jgi:tRNA A-37 threonylcarbamoyl transferase component Bud32
MACLSENTVLDVAAGRIQGGPAWTAVQAHLDQCSECRQLVSSAVADTHSLGASNAGEWAEVDAPTRPFERPPSMVSRASWNEGRVGRYVIRGLVGRGGMGVVYAAEDPELMRRVAIKLLRRDRIASGSSKHWKMRLLREARAIAQLSHPNVIAVHDVGFVEDDVFLVMELVDGATLSEWLSAQERTVAQILDVLLQAARGLAAAHAAGLVHRDFKPSNVLVGRDGRVRVVDFGVARSSESSESDPSVPASALLAGLTMEGALIGTPVYMSPEQLLGRSIDARCDQYSFCLTLYEALYGSRPFDGRTLEERAESIKSARLPRRAPRAGVPQRVHDCVLRGLAFDPAERFASMEPIAAALASTRDASRAPLLLAVSMAFVAAIAAGVAVAFSGPRPSSVVIEAAAAPEPEKAVPDLEPTAPARAKGAETSTVDAPTLSKPARAARPRTSGVTKGRRRRAQLESREKPAPAPRKSEQNEIDEDAVVDPTRALP